MGEHIKFEGPRAVVPRTGAKPYVRRGTMESETCLVCFKEYCGRPFRPIRVCRDCISSVDVERLRQSQGDLSVYNDNASVRSRYRRGMASRILGGDQLPSLKEEAESSEE